MLRRIFVFVIFLMAVSLCVAGCGGGKQAARDSARALVVINEQSADSQEVGSYYAQKRSIPERNVCRIKCPDTESISEDVYISDIKSPIEKYLQDNNLADSIDFIVLTRGIPIRYIRKTETDGKKEETAWGVDSSVVCLFTDYRGRTENPYFGSETPFKRSEWGFYLVTRLDGATLADAKALVDRSLAARPEKGLFLLDVDKSRDSTLAFKQINDDMRRAASILRGRSMAVRLEATNDFVYSEGLMGYYSWGRNDNRFDQPTYLKLKFLPGSIAELADSWSAQTLDRSKFAPKRSYAVEMIARGATGVKGYVNEPYSYALAVADILFDRYTSGRNLAESYYAASRLIHWQDIILGDPLCAPYAK